MPIRPWTSSFAAGRTAIGAPVGTVLSAIGPVIASTPGLKTVLDLALPHGI